MNVEKICVNSRLGREHFEDPKEGPDRTLTKFEPDKLWSIHTPSNITWVMRGKLRPHLNFWTSKCAPYITSFPSFTTSKNQLIIIKLHSEWVSDFKPEPALHHWNMSSKRTMRSNVMDSTKLPLANEEPNILLVNDPVNVAAIWISLTLITTVTTQMSLIILSIFCQKRVWPMI